MITSHEPAAGSVSQSRATTIAAADAAAYLGVAYNTLAIWRCQGRYSLPYIKVGRLVRYRKSDLDAFLAARTVSSAKAAA